MRLNQLAAVVEQAPVPAKGYHTEVHLAPDVYEEMMHHTQGRPWFGGVPLVRDLTATYMDARIVPDRRKA